MLVMIYWKYSNTSSCWILSMYSRGEKSFQDCLYAACLTLSPTWICTEDPGCMEFIAGSGLQNVKTNNLFLDCGNQTLPLVVLGEWSSIITLDLGTFGWEVFPNRVIQVPQHSCSHVVLLVTEWAIITSCANGLLYSLTARKQQWKVASDTHSLCWQLRK